MLTPQYRPNRLPRIACAVSPRRPAMQDGSPISQRQAEIVQISFHKGTGGIGLSIVAAQGIGDRDVGIYVKKVVAGSVADKDGRLEAGDQLLSVNGQPLIGITQEEAAQKMAKAGPDLCFEVSKQAAMYNGLATWLYQPSPQVMHVPPGGGIPHTLPNGIPPSNYAKANGGTNGYAGVAPQARFGSVSSLQHQQQQQQQPYMAQTQSSSGMNGGGPRQARFQPGPAAATFRQAPPPQTEPIQRHNRSASASELFHNQQTQSNRSSQHSVASLPRGAVVPAQQQHQQMQQQQQQQYHNLPGHYRPNQHISQTGVGPLLHQPPSSARSLPPLGHPISRNAVDPGHTERSQSPSALYRRPPSADVTASQVYRARIPSTASTSSSVFYPQSALTDYQNLPLIADTVNETTFPSDPAQSHYAHLSTARSAHPISHDLNPMQAASSALVHQQHQQQPQSNGDAVYSLSRAQEPFQPPPTSVGEQMRQRSTSVDVSPTQPHLSGRTSVPLYGNDTQQVENEVLRLMKEEMTRLENKPQLTEAEDRRYRALLFEIAYQTRLHEDERGSSSRSSSNDFSSTQPPPPSSTLVDHGRLTNASSSSPTVTADSPAATTMSAAQRQQQREQYFAEAESKLLEEAARQRHTGGVSRSPEHANWSPHHQQQNSHSVEPPTMLPPPTLMGELQQQMQQVLRVDNGESYQNSSPSPPTKEPSVVGKRPPPEVPPKHRRVQFTEPSGSLPEETTTNGVEEQTDLAKRYVFQEEEIEAPRVQVLGTQEVYRDPRQRRLNDMESKEQMKKSKTDGANLGFRDKMKLFAQQIGEQAPKNRVKASSAQREIEDQLDHSQ
uniref:PDZ domain-containing protein n=2 Tax=Plectus sambesii TaxID=2011161 RepID=A0A914VAQ6_9BILA